MKKKLIIINGTMGVGKTTLCNALHKKIEKTVWLDGDWCWMMNPWSFTEENKKMVEDNITYLLRNYLQNSSFEYVIFSWVIHQEAIFELILGKLKDLDFELHKITLQCSEKALQERMVKDGRDSEVIERSLLRLKLYETMNTRKIDTSDLSISEAVQKVMEMMK